MNQPKTAPSDHVGPMIVVGPLPNGCTLYRQETEQGYEYWSDEVGGGVRVWITALADPTTLLAAITDYYKMERQRLHQQ